MTAAAHAMPVRLFDSQPRLARWVCPTTAARHKTQPEPDCWLRGAHGHQNSIFFSAGDLKPREYYRGLWQVEAKQLPAAVGSMTTKSLAETPTWSYQRRLFRLPHSQPQHHVPTLRAPCALGYLGLSHQAQFALS